MIARGLTALGVAGVLAAAAWVALTAVGDGALAPGDFVTPQPLEAADCGDGAPDVDLDRTLPLSLVVGPGVTEAQLAAQTRALAAWAEPYGLSVTVVGPVEHIDTDWVLGGTEPELLAAMEAAGLSTRTDGGTPEAWDAIDDVVFGRLRALLAEHTQPPEPVVKVILLPRLAAEDSWADRYFSDLRGVSFSPALARLPETAGPERRLLDALDLPEEHTPVVLLGQADLDAAPPWQLPLTLTHELGHALGLPHVKNHGNLMHKGPSACVPFLKPLQVERMVEGLDALTGEAGLSSAAAPEPPATP